MAWADEFNAVDKPLPMLLNHIVHFMPMSEWNSFEFDDKGMTAKGRLYTNTVGGNDLYQILKESPKMFGGVSVGAYADEAQMVDADGNPVEDDDTDEAYFQITKGGLREVSVVMYPNNPNAEINKLEMFSTEGVLNIRSVEKTLREAGLTRKDATTASLVFKKAMEQREAVQKPIESLPTQGEPDAVVNEAEALLTAFEVRELVMALNKRI
jgi:HK97 family phage prohead protease